MEVNVLVFKDVSSKFIYMAYIVDFFNIFSFISIVFEDLYLQREEEEGAPLPETCSGCPCTTSQHHGSACAYCATFPVFDSQCFEFL